MYINTYSTDNSEKVCHYMVNYGIQYTGKFAMLTYFLEPTVSLY